MPHPIINDWPFYSHIYYYMFNKGTPTLTEYWNGLIVEQTDEDSNHNELLQINLYQTCNY